jgi:hypothetical protein
MKHADHKCHKCWGWLNEDRGCDRCDNPAPQPPAPAHDLVHRGPPAATTLTAPPATAPGGLDVVNLETILDRHEKYDKDLHLTLLRYYESVFVERNAATHDLAQTQAKLAAAEDALQKEKWVTEAVTDWLKSGKSLTALDPVKLKCSAGHVEWMRIDDAFDRAEKAERERDDAKAALELEVHTRFIVAKERTETEAQLTAERALSAELKGWKESAMDVMGKVNLQACGKALGLTLGSDIAPAILPGILRLQELSDALAREGVRVCDYAEGLYIISLPEHIKKDRAIAAFRAHYAAHLAARGKQP